MTDESIPDRLVWIDTETNGLQDDAVPLELGLLVTDRALNELWAQSWLVHPGYTYTDLIVTMESFVQEMHHKNGLLSDLADAWNDDTLTGPHTIELQAITLLTQAGVDPGKHPLCGSSAHFDRRIIKSTMPKLEAFFHYRNIDVSSLKELARIWAPTIYDNRPGKDDADKKHRVLDDVRASVAELRYYVEVGFIYADDFFKGRMSNGVND